MQGECRGHERPVRDFELAFEPVRVAGVRVFVDDEGGEIAEAEAEVAVFELEVAFGLAEDGGGFGAGWGDECSCFGGVR